MLQILGARELSWESFFSSFWAALDDRSLSSLDRSKASAAFLSSLLECLIFLIKRWKAAKYPSDIESSFVQAIIKNQLGHIWDDLGNRRLRVDGFTVGKNFARTLQSLFLVEMGKDKEVDHVTKLIVKFNRVVRYCME